MRFVFQFRSLAFSLFLLMLTIDVLTVRSLLLPHFREGEHAAPSVLLFFLFAYVSTSAFPDLNTGPFNANPFFYILCF
uniref:Uncharacterized protein n=1 Tax=Anguilla anguilla TaxID=7936 RepID=A0A0E9WUQ3_ANGAN